VADVKSSTVVKILTSQTFVDSDNIFPPFNTLQTHWISKQTYSFAESEPRKDLSMGSHPHHLLCMCDRLLALLWPCDLVTWTNQYGDIAVHVDHVDLVTVSATLHIFSHNTDVWMRPRYF